MGVDEFDPVGPDGGMPLSAVAVDQNGVGILECGVVIHGFSAHHLGGPAI